MSTGSVLDTARTRLDPLRLAGPRWAGFAARIIAGMLWLSNTDWKRPPDFGRPNRGLWVFTNHGIDNPVFGPFKWFLQEIVVPNFKLFGWITVAVEVGLAFLLLAGLWTRFAGLLGVGMSISITLSVLNTPGEYNWAYYLMIATHLAIIGLGAGPWSVDSLILKLRAGNSDQIRRSVNAGRVGLGALLVFVGSYIAYQTRDRSFSLSVSGTRYFASISTGNQALRGTVLLGLTLIAVGVAVAALAGTRAARPLGIALAVAAVLCVATYGTKLNVFGGAASTAAILLVPAAFLIVSARAARRDEAAAVDAPVPA